MRFKRLKYLLTLNDGGIWGDDPQGTDDDVVVLRSTDIALDGRWTIAEPATRTITPAERRFKTLREGDLVVVKSSGSAAHLGKTALVSDELALTKPCFANFVQRLRPSAETNSRYLWYVLNSSFASSQLEMLGTTTTGLRNLNGEILGSLACPALSLRAQRRITDFLDVETARIDALIEKKQRMIELLDERRRVVVDSLVLGTRHSDLAKHLKFPWIQGLPSEWHARSLRHLGRGEDALFTDGDWIESPFITDSGIRLIQTGNVGVGEYREQGFRYISVETFVLLKCTEVLPGDVLISRLAAPVGRACIAPSLGTRMITAVDVCIVRPAPSVDRGYLVNFLSSSVYLALLDALSRGGTRERVSRDQLGDVPVPVPPLEEQRLIVDEINLSTQPISAASSLLNEQIAKLREHRQALITAAVTGELDVGVAA